MSTPYFFHKKLVLRTPSLPVDNSFDESFLRLLLQNENFMEAIYLASPGLYEECQKLLRGSIANQKKIDKILLSIGKYYTRMNSRCTPFGLFSGCSIVKWGKDETSVVFNSKIKRHTRLDMFYLNNLVQTLLRCSVINQALIFYPNNSIYALGNELRFVETVYQQGKWSYQISSVEKSPYLEDILSAAAKGLKISEIVALLVACDISEEEALQFVYEVIEAQLLVSELTPKITGNGFYQQILNVLNKANLAGIAGLSSKLDKITLLLKNLDEKGTNNAAYYKALLTILDQIGSPYAENKVFQTDIIKECIQGNINEALQNKLCDALTVLNKLTAKSEHANLKGFTKRFHDRYGDKEVALLEALDTETGIGYLAVENDVLAPLINDISLPLGAENRLKFDWGSMEEYLCAKLKQANKQNSFNIDLDKNEISSFKADWEDLPPSMSVMFRLIDPAKNVVFLEGSSGSSGANLLGRFAHLDQFIHELINDITGAESANDPEVVYAEIVHLPEGRVGNILLRPSFRQYEIAYLAQSSVSSEYQISVQDLYVSVVNHKIVLRSKRLNKRVIPRLSTAHNYQHSTLPVYQFLCDLQLQEKRGSLKFSWGILEKQYRFLPRVTFGNTILSLAKWSFTNKDIEPLIKLEGEELRNEIIRFKKLWQLPDNVVLADGDNELLINFDNLLMVRAWLDIVRFREEFKLKEALSVDKSCIANLEGQPFSNQFIATLQRNKPAYTSLAHIKSVANKASDVCRKFSLGSEWLYYKLYCGVKSGDKILLEVIKPLTEKLKQEQLIDKWFFIRYNDPSFHVRFRVYIKDVSRIGEVILLCQEYFQAPDEAGYLWKVQVDTYERELERYGATIIKEVESVFHHDSVSVLEALDSTYGDVRENLRWLYAIQSVDALMSDFGLNLQEKLKLIMPLKDAFAAEFKIDRGLKQQLAQKHRDHKKDVELALSNHPEKLVETDIYNSILKQRSEQLKPTLEGIQLNYSQAQVQVAVSDLISSCIHMVINRVSVVNPRLHELLIYDLLFRYYQSMLARQKSKRPEMAEAL